MWTCFYVGLLAGLRTKETAPKFFRAISISTLLQNLDLEGVRGGDSGVVPSGNINTTGSMNEFYFFSEAAAAAPH
jgi:hypothetical protein